MTAPLLFVSGEYPPDRGGVGDYTARLRSALNDRGWPSLVLTRRHVGRWDARAVVRLLRLAPRGGIVHIQFQAAAFDLLGDICLVPLLVRRLRPRVRVVTTFHDTRVPYLFPGAGAVRARAVHLLARSSHTVIAAAADDLCALGGPSARHCQVPIGANITCGPPPGYERESFRASLQLAPDTLVVAYFGLLNASKGLDTLLATFDRLRTFEPDAHLLLLGGAIGASDPTDRLTAARVQGRISAYGARSTQPGWLPAERLSAYLLAADVALLPFVDGASARRGSLLACAAHGLPIVTTLPVAPEIDRAVAALPADPDLLAAAVVELHNDPSRAAALRAAARRLAARADWATIAAQHVTIYESLAADLTL